MRQYLRVLRAADFRRLWLGYAVSAMGDGMSFLALSWLVLSRPDGTARLGLLGVCYTAPVLLGGLALGPLLDRFDKRTLMACDSLLRAVVVASVPVTAALGAMPAWLPFAVAGTYGLLKMVPLAGFPASIPQLVDSADLDAANALESLGFSVTSVVGPAAAGLLIAGIGAANVLLVDGASFVVFAICAASVRRPLRPRAPATDRAATDPATDPGTAAVPPAPKRFSLASLARDRVIVATTIAFMVFNIADGMLMVTAPWLARNRLPGGAAVLGVLLSATAAGEIAGAAFAGQRRPGRSRVRAIGVAQVLAAAAFLCLLATPHQVLVGAGFFAVGLLTAPMTVWAQSLRMRRIPEALHGRAFTALRTLMQATGPLGSALVTPLLVHGRVGAAAVGMALLAGLPALYLITAVAENEPAPGAPMAVIQAESGGTP